MASQPDVLQSCLQEAARSARPALERCIEDAIAALQTAESQSMKMADRDEFARAWRELQKHKPAWSVQYPADLLVIFKANTLAAAQAARAPAEGTPAATNSARAPLSDIGLLSAQDGFSLVDDADVSQAIEAARLLQQVLPPVEQVLAELNTLTSSLQGLPNVRPDLNPLRPEAFTQALRAMVSASTVEPTTAALWVKHLSTPLGGELKRLYEALVQQLELANVQGVSYRVLQTPSSAPRGRGGAARPGDGTGPGGNGPGGPGGGEGQASDLIPPLRYEDLSDYEIKDELFQEFLFYGGGHAQHGLTPSYYEAVDEELQALEAGQDTDLPPPAAADAASDYHDVPAVDRPQRAVDERSHLSEKVWGRYSRPRMRALVRTQLKKEAQRVGQVLGLEVVRKLVNQVAQDRRLLVPVREAIVALEPSLLRLAMLDPRFFSDEGHPGRRLMERAAQRSFKYNDEYSPEFLAFFEPVIDAFNALNEQTIEDAQPFASALAKLESGWDQQDQHETQHRHGVLSALRFAEERQTQADQIAFDLSSRSDLEKVPGLVLDFLFGPWALAMAHARLIDTRNQVDPMGFGSVVPDLLWSVKRDVTLKRPAKLIEMIPSLLGKLHAGLELLGQDPRENEAFFEGLMRLHRPVLKLRRLKSQQDAEESGTMPLEPEDADATPEQRRAKVAEHPWLGREDLDAAGFEDTLPSAPGELLGLDDDAYLALEAQARGLSAEGVKSEQRPAAGPDTARAADEARAAASHANSEPAALNSDPAFIDLTGPAGQDTPADAADAQATPPGTLSRAEAAQLMLGLRAGHWVDLYSKRHWLRAQLIWASAKGTLFMFVSHGGQPHSMTQRSCERLIRERLLRPVAAQGVVAQALDAVVAEAQLAGASAPRERQRA